MFEFHPLDRISFSSNLTISLILGIFTYLKQSVRENLSKDLTPNVLEVLVDIFKVRREHTLVNTLATVRGGGGGGQES